MQAIKIANQSLAFSLELAMLVSLGYYGFQSGKSVFLKYALLIVLPLTTAILWGLFAAPKANYRLGQPARLCLELGLFLITSFLLYRIGNTKWAITFGVLAVISQLVALVTGE